MHDSKHLLNHMEKVHADYVELVDKIPTEDKIIMAAEEQLQGLEPWEISEIAQSALSDLPDGLEGHMDSLFDVVYAAVADASDRLRS